MLVHCVFTSDKAQMENVNYWHKNSFNNKSTVDLVQSVAPELGPIGNAALNQLTEVNDALGVSLKKNVSRNRSRLASCQPCVSVIADFRHYTVDITLAICNV